MNKKRVTYFRVLCLGALCGTLAQGAPARKEVPLNRKSFKEIVDQYLFIGDFNVKPETRPLPTEEIFWRYPLTLPKLSFPLSTEPANEADYPATPGEGRQYEHINRGRFLFLEGNYKEAKTTWLSARARYGKTGPYHRRIDYFLSSAFLRLAQQADNEKDRRLNFNNAATFLSWAFQQKIDLPDPLIDQVAPRGFYELAAIYFNHGRFAAAYGAANDGLNYLRKTGRKEYRPELRRILAESFIQNRTYLEAVQELDAALRQDVSKGTAASIFARVGDIYFDLNNFELAEDAYGIANRVDEQAARIHPAHFVLRGESLFWMGQFSSAQKMFAYAIEGQHLKNAMEQLPLDFAAVASIRTADAWLAQVDWKKIEKTKAALTAAQKKRELLREAQPELDKARKAFNAAIHPLEKAKLAYFKHFSDYRGHYTEVQARIRSACLELPEYQGKNINHTREMLEGIRKESNVPSVNGTEKATNEPALPKEAIYLAWACEVGSYAQHERTPAMVERVREFANAYPQSHFLMKLVEPVREVQSRNIEAYFAKGDLHGATQFFEKTRKALFPKVEAPLRKRLYAAYTDIYQPQQAAEFWPSYEKTAKSDEEMLKLTVSAAELASTSKKRVWQKRNAELAKSLTKRSWSLPSSPAAKLYLERILATKYGGRHVPWILSLTKSWTAQDPRTVCEWVYPLVSRAWKNPKGSYMRPETVRREGVSLVEKHLKEVVASQPDCAHSLLELEAQLFKKQPEALATLYLTRTQLPIDHISGNIIWSLSETLYNAREFDKARALWKHLSDHGPSELPEVKFARARLDKRKTELEKLWE